MTLHQCINPHIGGSPSPLDADQALFDALTAPTLPKADAFMRRDAELDPLLLAAAAASGPHVTRNHYHHDFFPGVMLPKAEGAWDWSKWNGDEALQEPREQKRYTYVSRQGPRRQKLAESKENDAPAGAQPLRPADNVPLRDRASSVSHASQSLITPTQHISFKDITVKCMARTRIPTPHGIAFLHLYHNNRDDKEHLAIVIDPAQLSEPTHTSSVSARPIRSSSLDAAWSDNETDMDRLTRGAVRRRRAPPVYPRRSSASTPNASRARPLAACAATAASSASLKLGVCLGFGVCAWMVLGLTALA
ncbi:hypothetical protein EWM64_g1153 [Hericium alpestre]|uniref:Uncharacterized protein n=1 Tax=Hericium alpestre TaxID=135208 RepID=A0A4Z0AB93_9AGAM|nr:hypothetical protein EWM64_g1153 [Hericium alpestre]